MHSKLTGCLHHLRKIKWLNVVVILCTLAVSLQTSSLSAGMATGSGPWFKRFDTGRTETLTDLTGTGTTIVMISVVENELYDFVPGNTMASAWTLEGAVTRNTSLFPAWPGYYEDGGIACIHDDTIFMAGQLADPSGATYNTSMILSKLYTNGTIAWNRTKAYPLLKYNCWTGVWANDTAIFTCGYSGNYTNYTTMIARWDVNGNVEWERALPGYGQTKPCAIHVLDGSIYIAGFKDNPWPDVAGNLTLQKWHDNGTQHWNRSWGTGAITDMWIDDSGIYICGERDYDFHVARLDHAGTETWNWTNIVIPSNGWFDSLWCDGEVIYCSGGTYEGTAVVLGKWRVNGTNEWIRTIPMEAYGDPDDRPCFGAHVWANGCGGVYVAGSIYEDTLQLGTDIYLMMCDEQGNVPAIPPLPNPFNTGPWFQDLRTWVMISIYVGIVTVLVGVVVYIRRGSKRDARLHRDMY